MIRVCDAIMGTGKTSATITYINEHKDMKFIYITPYLSEAARITSACDVRFVEPSSNLRDAGFTKRGHTSMLIAEGKNIATTHQSFKNYTPEMLEDIRRQEYTLIMDENVDVLDEYSISSGDLSVVEDAGLITKSGDEYVLTGKSYSGNAFRELMSLMWSRGLIRIDDGGDGLYYWQLPAGLLSAFKDVFVLTYLFDAQSVHHFLHMNGIQYKKVGISRTPCGSGYTYRFEDDPDKWYIPEYVHTIKDKIHILENDSMNNIGGGKYALSLNWFAKNTDKVELLKKNISNYFNNIHRGEPSAVKLWGTYCDASKRLSGMGYAKRHLAFNTKATNDYKGCTTLAYLANIYMNVSVKNFYHEHGIDVDEDTYALSIMVQWIWRSAIRDGNEIYLYIPSKRMRTILKRWMNTLAKGGGACGKATEQM